jgi:hypothetical protein
MWPSFFANVDFCFLRDRLQQLISRLQDWPEIQVYDTHGSGQAIDQSMKISKAALDPGSVLKS